MVDYVLLTSFAFSFIVTYIMTPYWIRAAQTIGLTGRDLNKPEKPEVAEMGGLPVNAGFFTGVFTYIALRTFYLNEDAKLVPLLAVTSTLLIIVVVGMIDDVLGWKMGLRRWQKPLFTSLAAIPMMAVNAGESSMALPLLGNVDLGILYPLLIIPIGITGAANGFNMLAGFNGLEAGMGIIILSALGYVAWVSGSGWVTMLALCMVFSLLAFLRYNWNPAKIFPGDTMTYSIGALIASVAILANTERLAILLFSLYFLELFLKARGGFKGESYGVPQGDGTLNAPKKIESITHMILDLGVKRESYVTLLILGLQVVLSATIFLSLY
jgi:UDP-N-acetylglucosamine--dolichyl-phosphate N-acetylglucosaminephosphotransferase